MSASGNDSQHMAHERPGDARSASINIMSSKTVESPARLMFTVEELHEMAARTSSGHMKLRPSDAQASEVASILDSISSDSSSRKISNASYSPLFESLRQEVGTIPSYLRNTQGSDEDDDGPIDTPLQTGLFDHIRQMSWHGSTDSTASRQTDSTDSTPQDEHSLLPSAFNLDDERQENTMIAAKINQIKNKSNKSIRRANCFAGLTSAIFQYYTAEWDNQLLGQFFLATMLAQRHDLHDAVARAQLWKGVVLHGLDKTENMGELLADVLTPLIKTGNDSDLFQLSKIWEAHANSVADVLFRRAGQDVKQISDKEKQIEILMKKTEFLMNTTAHVESRFNEAEWPDRYLSREAAEPASIELGLKPAEMRSNFQLLSEYIDHLKKENEDLMVSVYRYQAERAVFEQQAGLPLYTALPPHSKSGSGASRWSAISRRKRQSRMARMNRKTPSATRNAVVASDGGKSNPISKWLQYRPRTDSFPYVSPRVKFGSDPEVTELWQQRYEDSVSRAESGTCNTTTEQRRRMVYPVQTAFSYEAEPVETLHVVNPGTQSSASSEQVVEPKDESRKMSMADLLRETHRVSNVNDYQLPQTSYSAPSRKQPLGSHPLNRVDTIKSDADSASSSQEPNRRSTMVTMSMDPRDLPLGAALSPTKLKQTFPDLEEHQQRRRSSLIPGSDASNISHILDQSDHSSAADTPGTHSEKTSAIANFEAEVMAEASKGKRAQRQMLVNQIKQKMANKTEQTDSVPKAAKLDLDSIIKSEEVPNPNSRISWGSNVSPGSLPKRKSLTAPLTPGKATPVATVSNVSSNHASFDRESDQSWAPGDDKIQAEPKRQEEVQDHTQATSDKPISLREKDPEEAEPRPEIPRKSSILSPIRTGIEEPGRRGSAPHISSPLRESQRLSDDEEAVEKEEPSDPVRGEALNAAEPPKSKQQFPSSTSSFEQTELAMTPDVKATESISKPVDLPRPSTMTSARSSTNSQPRYVGKRRATKRPLKVRVGSRKSWLRSTDHGTASTQSESTDLYGSSPPQQISRPKPTANGKDKPESPNRRFSVYDENAASYGAITPDSPKRSQLSMLFQDVASPNHIRLSDYSQQDMKPAGLWSVPEPYRSPSINVNSFTSEGRDPWVDEAESSKPQRLVFTKHPAPLASNPSNLQPGWPSTSSTLSNARGKQKSSIVEGAELRLGSLQDGGIRPLRPNRASKVSARMSAIIDAVGAEIDRQHATEYFENLEAENPVRASQLIEELEREIEGLQNGFATGGRLVSFVSEVRKSQGLSLGPATNF